MPTTNVLAASCAGGERGKGIAGVPGQDDLVETRLEVEDDIDIAAAQRGGEGEAVGAAAAVQAVGTARRRRSGWRRHCR